MNFGEHSTFDEFIRLAKETAQSIRDVCRDEYKRYKSLNECEKQVVKRKLASVAIKIAIRLVLAIVPYLIALAIISRRLA